MIIFYHFCIFTIISFSSIIIIRFIFLTKGDFKPSIDSFRTQYFQLYCLGLAQRASITNFKNDIARISSLFRNESVAYNDRNCIENVTDMAEKFIAFESQLFFDEVSPEQQGIEIYDMVKNCLRLKEL